MARYWVRVRAEYVVPVLATSREDAMSLDAGDLCDDMTPVRLYHAEIIGAVPDSELQTYDCGAGLMLDAEQRAEHEIDVAMLDVGAAVREHFQHVRGIPRETLEAHVEDVIRGIADQVAAEVVAEGDDDWQARRAAIVAGINRRAASSAKAYTRWRTEHE